MRKQFPMWFLLVFLTSMLLLAGCSKENGTIIIYATTPLEMEADILDSISVTLPDDMTREAVSNIQNDFILDGKQVGGIVIVDIPNEMLDAPYENIMQISDLLGQQLMPNEDPDKIMFMGAGGNDYAYMEIYTGGEEIRFFHYLFRGEENNYDVWFAYDLVDEETIAEIIATVSADDITADLNKSVM